MLRSFLAWGLADAIQKKTRRAASPNNFALVRLAEGELRPRILTAIRRGPAARSEQRFNDPGDGFLKTLGKWSMFPLVEFDLTGVLNIISKHHIHFIAERMTENNRVDLVVAGDAPPIQIRSADR